MKRLRERGVALLTAMLTVALVASLAAAALWQQWRSVEVEAAERGRTQAAWILTGALDWARLILREDARSGGADHLGEPWAVALQEARLSTFLSADGTVAEEAETTFLSGQIIDQQSLLNVTNLVEAGRVSEPGIAAFARLFELLGLPRNELVRLAENLRFASDISTDNRSAPQAALLPQKVQHLAWMGLSVRTVAVLEPYITVLPQRTGVNLNTASAEVIYAAVAGLSEADARRLVAERDRGHFRTTSDAARLVPGATEGFTTDLVTVASRFFEVRGRLRMGDMLVEERSLVRRDGIEVRAVQRERGVVDPTALSQASLAAPAPR
jgi:general secretion pathway protein K